MGKKNNSKKSRGGGVGATRSMAREPGGKNVMSARESDERRLLQLQQLEIKRLHNLVQRHEEEMMRWRPPDKRKKPRIDKNYALKGAARPAMEHYQDPNYEPQPDPTNLMDLYEGKMWEHWEGQVLLERLLEYGVSLHNVGNKSKDAIKVFERMLRDDPDDHLLARRALLRCYLDIGYAQEARDLIERRFPEDRTACFNLAKVLIEFISAFVLKEDDATEAAVDQAMDRALEANPYVLWPIVHHSTFTEATDHLEEMASSLSSIPPGGPLEALQYFYEDFPLWLEVEGIVDWVKEYATRKSIPFPPPAAETPEVPPCSPGDEEDESKTGPEEEEEHDEQEGDASSSQQQEAEEEQGQSESDLFEMYGGMYRTAIEMILDESRHGV